MQYLVLGVNNYNFTDKESNRNVEGLTAWCISQTPVRENGKEGFLPLKISLDKKFNEVIKEVPALYDFEFESVPTTSGKFKTIVKNISYAETYSLFSA